MSASLVGSEMCIRDRQEGGAQAQPRRVLLQRGLRGLDSSGAPGPAQRGGLGRVLERLQDGHAPPRGSAFRADDH
eukprot:614626-Alexandrium_andersonii.AAC.1